MNNRSLCCADIQDFMLTPAEQAQRLSTAAQQFANGEFFTQEEADQRMNAFLEGKLCG